MLNISKTKLNKDEVLKDQSAYIDVMDTHARKNIVYLLTGIFFLGFVILFLPWTQNIRAKGKLTAIDPADRAQVIHSVISGRVEKWYVKEGQHVGKGDTIVYITEVKPEYLDPELVAKTGNQANVKFNSIQNYKLKAEALGQQISALEKNKGLKMAQAKNYYEQARLKVISDSIQYETAKLNNEIAANQFERIENLYKQGLKSLTDFQKTQQKQQETVNKKISAENKWLASKNSLINAELNLGSVQTEYQEKIAKANSDKMSALSMALQAESEYNKLSIQQENYSIRSKFYYITAPQDGYITQALVTGLGEIIKAGQAVFSFIPSEFHFAVEMYVRPIDLPLIREGHKVQLQFDGWPALVFSGWPGLSFGTYAGEIVGYDKVVSSNGKFRVLITPDESVHEWPELLRIGSGVQGIAMLKEVQVWYELWRNLNGFPPDFYISKEEEKEMTEKPKAKIKIK